MSDKLTPHMDQKQKHDRFCTNTMKSWKLLTIIWLQKYRQSHVKSCHQIKWAC